MGVKTDRFKKAFTGNVSDKMLASRVQKAQAEIARLKTNIQALTQAGIGAEVYQRQVPVLEKQQTDALKGTTNEAKYEALEQVKLAARERADAAAEALHNRPNQTTVDSLKQLLDSDGVAALDDRVKDIGAKCKKPADRKQMLAIIEARWGLSNINGDLDSKTLPMLYKCFSMVPQDHIKGNKALTEIRRDASPPVGEASFYSGGKNSLIVLNLGDAGEWADIDHTITGDDGTTHTASYYDHTTLHEIGHAVDERLKYMATNGKNANRGGWKTETPASIAHIASAHFGFADDFPTLPKALVVSYLFDVLASGTPPPQGPKWLEAKQIGDSGLTRDEMLADPGIQDAETARLKFETDGWPVNNPNPMEMAIQDARTKTKLKASKRKAAVSAIDRCLRYRVKMADVVDAVLAEIPTDIPDDGVFAQMEQHEAVKWCKSVRMSGSSSGLWDQGASGATAGTIDGRVYKESYKSEWCSYEATARQGNVSNYQFRAAGEWFAELYAVAYMGWLGDNHWIKQLQMPPAG